MDRRDVLRRLGAGGAGASLGSLRPALLGVAGVLASPPSRADSQQVPGRSARTAWQRNFATVPEQFGPTRLAGGQPLPKGLRGVLYRNGPARFHRGGLDYRHWFDGDGMVQAFRLTDDGIEHQARMIRTAKYRREEQAGRLLYPGFGTALAEPAKIDGPDDVNVANISVLPINQQLLALWEAGSAYQIDPDTLQTRQRQVWSTETDGMPFSAHPKVAPDGTVWSFGYLPGTGKLALYQFDRDNRLRRTEIIEAPNADMVHDFAITDRYLVFVLMPLVFDKQQDGGSRGFLGKYTWRGNQASVLLLVDKSTLRVAQRIELPTMALFHMANAWDDGGSVRVQFMRIGSFDALSDDIYRAMAGQPLLHGNRTQAVEIVASVAAARAKVSVLNDMDAEFPRIDPRRVGQRTRLVFACCQSPRSAATAVAASSSAGTAPGSGSTSAAGTDAAFGFDSVFSLDTVRARVDRFDYGPHTVAEEHVYVPRAGAAEGQGWLIGTAYDWLREQSLFSVFDAQAIAAGPVTQVTLPYAVPLGLHGAFVPRAAS